MSCCLASWQALILRCNSAHSRYSRRWCGCLPPYRKATARACRGLPRFRAGISLACIKQCRPVTGKSVVVHKTAQPVDFERSKQPPFLRRVEQCEGLFRLLKRDSLNIFTGVHAVPSGCLKAGMPGVAGGEQESHPQADSYDIWFLCVIVIVKLFYIRQIYCIFTLSVNKLPKNCPHIRKIFCKRYKNAKPCLMHQVKGIRLRYDHNRKPFSCILSPSP